MKTQFTYRGKTVTLDEGADGLCEWEYYAGHEHFMGMGRTKAEAERQAKEDIDRREFPQGVGGPGRRGTSGDAEACHRQDGTVNHHHADDKGVVSAHSRR